MNRHASRDKIAVAFKMSVGLLTLKITKNRLACCCLMVQYHEGIGDEVFLAEDSQSEKGSNSFHFVLRRPSLRSTFFFFPLESSKPRTISRPKFLGN